MPKVGKARGVGSVLNAAEMRRRISDLSVRHAEHIDIVPFDPKAIQAASLDLRLGNWFVSARRGRLEAVELGKASDERRLATVGREEFFVAFEHTFLVHPGDLVLGATLEFVALPPDVMGFVEGRSGHGRKGLIVATAAQVAPGFHGVIVLELVNSGTVPLKLAPGLPVAQLVFQLMTQALKRSEIYRGNYYCQIRP